MAHLKVQTVTSAKSLKRENFTTKQIREENVTCLYKKLSYRRQTARRNGVADLKTRLPHPMLPCRTWSFCGR